VTFEPSGVHDGALIAPVAGAIAVSALVSASMVQTPRPSWRSVTKAISELTGE
jgi:hypothetical protein